MDKRTSVSLAAVACLAVLAAAGPAWAVCPTPPATTTTNYEDSATRHLLCLQEELSTTSDALAEQARVNADLQRLNDLIRDQRQQIGLSLVQPLILPSP